MEASSTPVPQGRVLRSSKKRTRVEPILVDSDEDDEFDQKLARTKTTQLPAVTTKQRKKGTSRLDDEEDYQPSSKPPTAKKPKPPTKKQIKEQEKALKAERKLEVERQERKRQAELKAQEEERLLILRQANEARRQREAPLIAQQKDYEEKMAWKEGQKTHLFDLPPEILETIFAFDQDYSIKDYICITATCWYLRLPFLDDEVWRTLYMRNVSKSAELIRDAHTMNTMSTSVGVTSLNLLGNHPPIKRIAACEIEEALRPKDMPDKTVRFGVGVRPENSSHAKCQRMQTMISAYNRCSSLSSYSTSAPGQADEEATLEAKQKGRDVALWVSGSLPVSRTDARSIGYRDTVSPLFIRDCWDYGPWATQVLRSCNFPIISENMAYIDYWLAPEDLECARIVPKELYEDVHPSQLFFAREPKRYYFKSEIKDIVRKLKPVIEQRKSYGSAIMACFSTYYWFYRAKSCSECQNYHIPGQAGHSFWFNVIGLPQETLDDLREGMVMIEEMDEHCMCGYCSPFYFLDLD